VDSRYGVSPSERVVGLGEPVPKGGGVYRVGQPYVVGGRTYYPEYDPHYEAVGLASWYGDDFHGRYTANGEIFDRDGISAAHPTLPMPSYVRVTNLANGRSLIVRINDRGPYAGNRIIDVSTRAARLLGFLERGTAKVRVEFVGKAPVEGSDDRVLEATLRQNEPAPAPWTVKLASTDVAPSFPNQPPPVGVRLPAPSLERVVPNTDSMRSMSFTNGPGGLEGPDQFLNGRGLY
jgi:rare lipoprotein A